MGAQEFFARAVEARLMQKTQGRTDNLAVDQLRVHPEDLPVVELIPDTSASEAFVEVFNRGSWLGGNTTRFALRNPKCRDNSFDESKTDFDEI